MRPGRQAGWCVSGQSVRWRSSNRRRSGVDSCKTERCRPPPWKIRRSLHQVIVQPSWILTTLLVIGLWCYELVEQRNKVVAVIVTASQESRPRPTLLETCGLFLGPHLKMHREPEVSGFCQQLTAQQRVLDTSPEHSVLQISTVGLALRGVRNCCSDERYNKYDEVGWSSE